MSEDMFEGLWEHIDELSKRLRRVLFTVVITTFIFASVPTSVIYLELDFQNSVPLVNTIMAYMEDTLLPDPVNLIAFNWLDSFYVYMVVSVSLGVLLVLPYIVYEIYMFVSPALYRHEKQGIVRFVGAFIALFTVGVLYAFYFLLPATFTVLFKFLNTSRVMPFYALKDFYDMVALGLFGSGLFYTFPLWLYTLVRAEVIYLEDLKNNRKQFFVAILIITAVLTPDPTPFTMLMMTVPFYILFEVSLLFLKSTSQDINEKLIEEAVKASKKLLAAEEADD